MWSSYIRECNWVCSRFENTEWTLWLRGYIKWYATQQDSLLYQRCEDAAKTFKWKPMTLKHTLTIAYLMESAATYSKSIADHQTLNSTTDKINIISKVQPKTFEKKCYWCGCTKQTAQNCPFKEAECFYCHWKGHTIQVCRTKATNEGIDKRIPNCQRLVNIIETTGGNKEHEIFDLYTLHRAYSRHWEHECIFLGLSFCKKGILFACTP